MNDDTRTTATVTRFKVKAGSPPDVRWIVYRPRVRMALLVPWLRLRYGRKR